MSTIQSFFSQEILTKNFFAAASAAFLGAVFCFSAHGQEKPRQKPPQKRQQELIASWDCKEEPGYSVYYAVTESGLIDSKVAYKEDSRLISRIDAMSETETRIFGEKNRTQIGVRAMREGATVENTPIIWVEQSGSIEQPTQKFGRSMVARCIQVGGKLGTAQFAGKIHQTCSVIHRLAPNAVGSIVYADVPFGVIENHLVVHDPSGLQNIVSIYAKYCYHKLPEKPESLSHPPLALK